MALFKNNIALKPPPPLAVCLIMVKAAPEELTAFIDHKNPPPRDSSAPKIEMKTVASETSNAYAQVFHTDTKYLPVCSFAFCFFTWPSLP